MEEIKWISTKSDIYLLLIKITASREEIELKHPGRTDLINSMKQSEEDLRKVVVFLRMAHDEQLILSKEYYALRLENLQLQEKNRLLEKTNLNLLNNVTL